MRALSMLLLAWAIAPPAAAAAPRTRTARPPARAAPAAAAALRTRTTRPLARDSAGRALVPEIMKLRDGQVVPRKVFSRYSANVIAESIVARINRRNLTPTPEEDEARQVAISPLFALRKVPFEARAQAELHYYFPREQAAAIASDGVRNLHQLPKLQYWDRRSKWRKGIEFGLARIHLDDPDVASAESPANMVRPKSVVLDVSLGAEFEMRTWLNHIDTDPSRGAQRYGDLVAVLKPTVYKRTTITPCDSGAAERWSCELSRQWVRPLTDRFLYANRPYTEYYEGQVWGKIGVADIQEFRVAPGTDARTLATLRGTGLPIYTYKVVREFDRYRRIRGLALTAGP